MAEFPGGGGLTPGSVVDADVSAGAAIAESKLALATDAAAGTASRRTLGIAAAQAVAGEDVRVSQPPRMTFPQPKNPKVISAFQGGEIWTKSGGGTQTYDTTDFEFPAQSLKLVTNGAAGSLFTTLTIPGGARDMHDKTLVISIKVDDFTKYGLFQLRAGSGGDVSTNYHYCQPAYTSASQRWVRQGEWWRIPIPMTDSGRTTGGWKAIGTGANLAAIDTLQIKCADLGAGACTFHVGYIGYQDGAPNPICSIEHDDARDTHWTIAASILAQYNVRAAFNLIAENIGTSGYLTEAQIYAMRNMGHEMALHAYSNVAGAQVHSLGMDAVTSAQAQTDLTQIKNWHYTRGMRGVNKLALPHGSENVAGVNPNVLEQVRVMVDVARGTHSTTLEAWPPGDPHRIRAYVASSTGGDNAAVLLAILDDGIAHGWYPIFVFHNLVATPVNSSDFAISEYTTFVAGVATRIAAGLVVKPLGEMLRSGTTPPSSGNPSTLVTTKGDLLAGKSAGVLSRLGVGSDTQVLTADSSQPSGVKWAAVPGASGGLLATNNLSDLVSAAAARANMGLDGNWRAKDHGYIAWTTDPANVVSSSILATAGTVYCARIKLDVAESITSVVFDIAAAGSGLTSGQCFAAVFQAGALLGVSADQSTLWQTANSNPMALVGGPFPATPGDVIAALFANGTTLLPTLARGGAITKAINANLSNANSRFASADTGRTTSMPLTLGTLTPLGLAIWAAVL